MFVPHTTCTLTKFGGYDQYAKRIDGTTSIVPCSIAKLDIESQDTSVREYASASRGASREQTAKAVFLFPISVSVGIEDVILALGYKLRVIGVMPRQSVMGKLDHYQVSADIWRA